MILADTSIWIEYLRDRQDIAAMMDDRMMLRQVVGLEVIFGELLQGARSKQESTMILEYWKNLPHVEEEGLWIEAGFLAARERLFAKGVGLIDACLMVCTRKNRLKLWTLDKKLKSVLSPSEIYDPPT